MEDELLQLLKLHAAAIETIAVLLDDEKLAEITTELKARIMKLEEMTNLKNIPPLRKFFPGDEL